MAGLGMAGVYVPGMRFVADWYAETAHGTAMRIHVGTFSLGSGLSFLISSAVASTGQPGLVAGTLAGEMIAVAVSGTSSVER